MHPTPSCLCSTLNCSVQHLVLKRGTRPVHSCRWTLSNCELCCAAHSFKSYVHCAQSQCSLASPLTCTMQHSSKRCRVGASHMHSAPKCTASAQLAIVDVRRACRRRHRSQHSRSATVCAVTSPSWTRRCMASLWCTSTRPPRLRSQRRCGLSSWATRIARIIAGPC